MSLNEINLPINCKIFSEEHKMKILKKEELMDIIINSSVKEKICSINTLVIINDAHRSTPSHRILDLISRIVDHKIKEIIIATGTHSPPSDQELRKILKGQDKKLNAKVTIHDANMNGLIEFGKTSRGTTILINPIVKKYQHILIINGVEPHFFAGYTGGVKSIVPGLAGKDTVVKNHSWAMHEKARPTAIDDNPLQLDLWEGYEMIEKQGVDVSAIQMVNLEENILYLIADSLREAFRNAIIFAEKIYVKQADHKFDVIVSFVNHPLNRSLYQAQKGIENTRSVLETGGDMILIAKCYEGLGNDAFYNTMTQFETQDEIINNLSLEKYRFGDHKAVKFATITKNSNLYIISDLDNRILKTIFAKGMSLLDLESFLSEKAREGKRIAIVLNGAMLTLKLKVS